MTGVGLAWSGAGPMNGDMAVYAHQAATGMLFERWVHVGYVALLMIFPWADASSALGVGLGVTVLGSHLAGERGSEGMASLLMACAVLPWCAFGEVDGVWFALFAIGVWAGPGVGGASLAAAVLVSPTVLAGLPWVVWERRDRRWVVPVLAIVMLIVLSRGDWLWGNRGLLTGGWSPDPWVHLKWALIPAVMAGRRLNGAVLLGLFGVLAPGDVPGHWILLPPIVARACENRDRRYWAALLALVVWSGSRLEATHSRVTRENETIGQIVTQFRTNDVFVGPWSWRVRIGLLATGDPNGVATDDGVGPCTGRRVRAPLGTWEPCAAIESER